MAKLIDSGRKITTIKSIDISTITSVLATSKAEANLASTAELTVEPTITTQPDAQEEANRDNQKSHAAVVAKDGAT